MQRWTSVFAFCLIACGGNAASSRAEPPSGAVDVRELHGGLATPATLGGAGAAAGGGCSGPGCGDPSLGGLGALGALPGGLSAAQVEAALRAQGASGASGASGAGEAAAAAPSSSEASGKITMTREHCETLGRKFAELSKSQQGFEGLLDDGGSSSEGASVGRDFAAKCARDLVGQPVEAREFQCLLRAKSANDLTACKR